MAAITEQRNIIQQEETKFQAAVSEGTMSRMGASVNFINVRQMDQHNFNINGNYGGFVALATVGDGFMTYPYPFEIVQVSIFSGPVVGTGGATELDIKWKPETGGAYASIFSTTPKFGLTGSGLPAVLQSARNDGPAVTSFTLPVLSKTQFAANDILICQLVAAMSGNPNGASLKLFVRPIST
jgi:hypothetical protein